MSTQILEAVKDLLKISLTFYIQTNHPALTMAIQTLFLATFAYFFANGENLWYYKLYLSFLKTPYVFSRKTYPSILEMMKERPRKIHRLKDDANSDLVVGNIEKYIRSELKWAIASTIGDSCENGIYTFTSRAKDHVLLWIYRNRCIWVGADVGGVFLAYEDKDVLTEFLRMIEKFNVKQSKESDIRITQMVHHYVSPQIREKKPSKPIYGDVTMERFISRHKPKLMNALNNFVKTCEKGALFHGYGSHNLGIMLYGEPGCGKTYLCKAICNYLKRDAKIIDMRQIKTRNAFEEIFEDVEKFVYIFDEFDFVQGVITTRDKDDSKQVSKVELLRMEYLKAMTQEKNESVLKEIKKQIDDEENVLSLDTLLTVLDGTIEMRKRVIIATTNVIDRIDKALLRSGRFDMKINLTKFDREETVELLCRMYRDVPNIEEIISRYSLKNDAFTPTDIVNIAVQHENVEDVLKCISN